MRSMKRRIRIVVCGTGFGHAWIDAITRCRRRYELVAIIARGSRHSKDICHQYGVPMATSVPAVKTKIDAAIVAIGGKAGEDITNEWLIRGVPVLMEHPVSPSFIGKVQRRGESFTRIHVNGHFCDLPTVIRFIKICKRAIEPHRAFSVAVIATPRTLYSCLDIAIALLPSREMTKIRFRRPELNFLGDPEYRLGPLHLKVNLMCSTSSADDAAGSLGGHFIQLWLPDQRITLVGPTGPIIMLGSVGHRGATWIHSGASSAPSWYRYSVEQRPAALIAALDRIVRNHSKSSRNEHLQRALLVSRIWDNVIHPTGF